MFSKLFNTALLAASAIAGVTAIPMPQMMKNLELAIRETVDLAARDSISFDNWGGISSLNGFDNFYGRDNFAGKLQSQNILIIQQQQQVVCRTQSIVIIQQRLLVIQEMAKRIITEQICEVETQTVVFQQFQSSLGSFGQDIRRKSNNNVGYDRQIANKFKDVLQEDGSLSNNDLGFTGKDLGKQYVVPNGGNWNNSTSPASVEAIYEASQNATLSSNEGPSNSTSS